MKTWWSRATTLWATDRVLLIVGVALLAASPLWWPWLLPLAWAALGLGLFARLAKSTTPPAGHTPIGRVGSGEVPRADLERSGAKPAPEVGPDKPHDGS